MLITLSRFQENVKVPVEAEYSPKEWELEFVDLTYRTPVRMSGTVEKGPEVVVFEGRLECSVEHICGRCLKKIPERILHDFKLYYETKQSEVIDASGDLREMLLLKHGIAYQCPDPKTCKLPYTKKQRTDSKASEADHMTYKAFSGLKEIWNKKREAK
ncbi:MAG: YceD family protein [Candidatus Omnitrophota bacterium]